VRWSSVNRPTIQVNESEVPEVGGKSELLLDVKSAMRGNVGEYVERGR
jgi:hypothetical protein